MQNLYILLILIGAVVRNEGAWCRWKGNLDCGDYSIQCVGRGLLDCTGNEDDQGFLAMVKFLSDPFLMKLLKQRKNSGDGGQNVERFLDRILNGNSFSEAEEEEEGWGEGGGLLSLFGDDEWVNDMNFSMPTIDIPVDEPSPVPTVDLSKNNGEGWDSYDVFVAEEESKPLLTQENDIGNFSSLFEFFGLKGNADVFEKAKDSGVQMKTNPKDIARTSSERSEKSFQNHDNQVNETKKFHDIEDEISSWNSTTDQKDDPTLKMNLKESSGNIHLHGNGVFMVKNASFTTNSRRTDAEIGDRAPRKTKRTISFRPLDALGIYRSNRRGNPINSFRKKTRMPLKEKMRPGVVELQRRHERLMDVLKSYKKSHSVKLGHMTTEVALQILAADILHKLHSTSSRTLRDVSSSPTKEVFGGPHMGSCRVFNLTCSQVPPLSACSGAAIGGCIDGAQMLYKLPRFIIAISVFMMSVIAIVSLLVGYGVYKKVAALRIHPNILPREEVAVI